MREGQMLHVDAEIRTQGPCFMEVAGRITKVETVMDLVDVVLASRVGDATWRKPFEMRAEVMRDLLGVLEGGAAGRPETWFLSARDCYEAQQERMWHLARAFSNRGFSVTWHDGEVFWASVPKWKGWMWFPSCGPKEATATVYDIEQAAQAGRKGIRQLLLNLKRAVGEGPEFEKGLRATARVVESVRRALADAAQPIGG